LFIFLNIKQNTIGITNRLNPSKSYRKLEKNHRILPLAIINRIIDEINPKKSSKEFEEKLQEMPLKIFYLLIQHVVYHRCGTILFVNLEM
jgi:hypothetical protein